jgi:serine/threonine-protein kinase
VAHRAGVVHRDVKPGNVLVGTDGVVKITDFGIARSASSVPLTQAGQLIGTVHYMSPEQVAGGRAGPASDVYALGLVAYECLAGRRAFDGESSVQIALRRLHEHPEPLPGGVPDPVRELIDISLATDPARRWADGAAFEAAIADVLAGRYPTSPCAGGNTHVLTTPGWAPSEPLPRRRRARRVLAPLVALLAGAGIAAAGLEVLGYPEAPAATADDPSAIVLVAGDYLGRPVDQVEAELGALGLRVERAAQETAASPPGSVTELSPVGAVREGDRIRLTYAVAPADDEAPDFELPEMPDFEMPDFEVPDGLIPDFAIPEVVIPDLDLSDGA